MRFVGARPSECDVSDGLCLVEGRAYNRRVIIRGYVSGQAALFRFVRIGHVPVCRIACHCPTGLSLRRTGKVKG